MLDQKAKVGCSMRSSTCPAPMDVGPHGIAARYPSQRKGRAQPSDNQFVDLMNIIDQLERLGRLDNGERPVVIVTHNGWRLSRGTELGRRLAEIEREIEAAYGGDEPWRNCRPHRKSSSSAVQGSG